MICNHSPIAQQQFCCYIINKLLTSSLEMPPNVEHVLLQRLKVEENVKFCPILVCGVLYANLLPAYSARLPM